MATITLKLFKARTFLEHGSMINGLNHVSNSLLSCLCPMVNSVADASTLAPSQMSSAAARPSLLSRLLHLLVPCISPQSTTHTVELDSQPISKTPLQEKLESKPAVHTDEVVPQDTASLPPPLSSDLTKLTLVTPSSSRPATPPLPSDNVEEVVHVPTTHLLLPDETAGMTSGAVQAPGSKGDSPTVEKPHPPLATGDGDDSEGTSYTEEDIDEQDDDEDRLIFNGGAGIPTGPVSSSRPWLIVILLP